MLLERANAKINLSLDILSRRENGYHEILSVMQSISLCDLITLDFRPELQTRIDLEASGNDRMPTDCRNLAWRAAEQFLLATGKRGKVWIRIEKHIPMEAGLAGGSTDAAAVLRGLNRLTGNPLSVEQLEILGARLGADVPFCIHGGGMQVRGIGELLTPITPLPDCPMVVACMGEGVSTPSAYAALDALYSNFHPPREESKSFGRLCRSMENGDLGEVVRSCSNLFEEVILPLRPAVGVLKERMTACGAKLSLMSGSGPSVFGIFETLEAADAAEKEIRALGGVAYVCHPTKSSFK